MPERQTAQTIEDWTSRISERGHAATFAATTKAEKSIVEIATAREWANSLELTGGPKISNLRLSEQDPPDCLGELHGKNISIELTELVDGKVLDEVQQSRRISEDTPSLFAVTQWTSSRFKNEITLRLNDKSSKYARRGINIDVLIIHTDEEWLLPRDVETWLEQSEFPRREGISRAYLLMTYDPSYAEHWPLFKLFGEPL